MYGVLFGLWTFLFLTDFLERYRPAWEAYTIVVLFSLLFPVLLNFLEKYIGAKRYIRKQQIPWFVYSFWVAIMSLLVVSFSFAATAMIQTKKTIEKYAGLDAKYCIQYTNIDTWLDLTPLTTWNKSSGNWGATKNHAILVVKTPKTPAHLYNWSYKSKKWEYITTGFKPDAFTSPSYLECNLEKDFSAKIPFINPQTNSFYVGKRKIKIPPEYFPQQEDYIFANIISDRERRKKIKTVEFLALTPKFNSVRQIFTKLSNEFNIWRKIGVSPLINKNDLEIMFNIRDLAKFEQANSQYDLEKGVFNETANHLNLAKRRLYYQKRNGVIKTIIECAPNLQTKFSCSHFFIHDDFIFTFHHREKDLKIWQILQNRLIDKVDFWQRNP